MNRAVSGGTLPKLTTDGERLLESIREGVNDGGCSALHAADVLCRAAQRADGFTDAGHRSLIDVSAHLSADANVIVSL